MKNKSSIKFMIAGVFVVLASVLYSCGGGGGGSYGGSGGTPTPTSSTVQAVACPGATLISIVNLSVGFNPSSVTVPVNSIVQWTNNDPSMTHTVTSTTVPANGTFDSGNLAPGASICLKFTSAGAFNYHCSIHPTTMIGKVTVQ
jgi:plastocyanin